MIKERLIRRIAVAVGREPADLVIKNGKIIDVFNGEVIYGDIAIADGYIAGIGEYEGHKIADAKGSYISPGFIDGHVHIESSLLTPGEFARVLLTHGVTAAVADPHEIANVSGISGLQYMLDASEGLPFDFYFMLPSSVPAADFEYAGARLDSLDLKPFFSHPRVLGLGEVMNYPAILNAQTDMIEKIIAAESAGKKIDGHAAGLGASGLNVYSAAGIRTDHEAITAEEAKERLRKGMYLMIREGTAAKDLEKLLPAVNQQNSRRCLFVTDDKHLDDLLEEGSIDHHIRLAVKSGLPPITAIQMATLNAAECFGLKNQGALAPGYKADMVFLESLEELIIERVFKEGVEVVSSGKLLPNGCFRGVPPAAMLKNTVKISITRQEDLKIRMTGNKANVIEIIPGSLVTRHIIEEIDLDSQNSFQASTSRDLLNLAVIERHRAAGHIGLGIVKGLGLQSGAIASTVAHDSHNLIIAGTNDKDMLAALRAVEDMQGGLAVIKEGEMLASLKLPVSGLMSDQSYEEAASMLADVNNALKHLGANKDVNPFLALSFLALPVIPEIKLTASGLFSVSQSAFIPIEANHKPGLTF
ncbi:adenine deaminase [Bacillus sp. MMSF_3328]|uniref:adenine deaminase n=1 Tax=Bacillus sp. MMSF_3328 TaxID=3047080 RepID=UPI00273F7D2D|nr:adenine deaminase [Bacillus sp. MMSF_3328]